MGPEDHDSIPPGSLLATLPSRLHRDIGPDSRLKAGAVELQRLVSGEGWWRGPGTRQGEQHQGDNAFQGKVLFVRIRGATLRPSVSPNRQSGHGLHRT